MGAVGMIEDARPMGRAPSGEYAWTIAMVITREGHRRRTLTSVHLIPKNKTHLLSEGATYPLKIRGTRVVIDWARYVRVDGRKVLDRVVTSVGRVLRKAGYRKTSSRTFNATREPGLIHVVDFQASRYGDAFTVNVAVFVRELRKARSVNLKDVKEYDCSFKLRWRIGELLPRKGDAWWPYEQAVETTAAEVGAKVERYVLPHLARYGTRALVQAAFKRAKQTR